MPIFASATCTFATADPETTSPSRTAKSGSTTSSSMVEAAGGRLLILGDLFDWWQVPVGSADQRLPAAGWIGSPAWGRRGSSATTTTPWGR